MKKAIEWAKEYWNVEGNPSDSLTEYAVKEISELIKKIQEDTIRETVKECINCSRIRVEYSDGCFGYMNSYWAIGAMLKPDKDAIISVADKLLKEL